jgi:predicted nucleic acid-binding protein
MNVRKGLVLDANILVRAVFGTHVRSILESFEDTASFFFS